MRSKLWYFLVTEDVLCGDCLSLQSLPNCLGKPLQPLARSWVCPVTVLGLPQCGVLWLLSVVPALRAACAGHGNGAREFFPSQVQEEMSQVSLTVKRMAVANEIVKPVEHLLDSSTVNSPGNTNPWKSRVWLLEASRTRLPSPDSVCLGFLGAPGTLRFAWWNVLYSSVALAEKVLLPSSVLLVAGLSFYSCQRLESPDTDCSVPLGFKISFFFC